jgi:PAP2 superfamily
MRTALQRANVLIRAWALGVTLAVAAVLAAPAAAGAAAPAPATAASAGAVLDWYRYAGQAINQAAQERGQPQRARLEMAMVQGAVYDAVNAIARTNQPYLVAPRAQRWYSKDAAAATAAYRVLIALLPERQPALAPLYQQSLAAIADGAAKTGGSRVGEQAAAAMPAAREGDGRDGPRQPVIGTEPGEWRPTPPAFAVAPVAWIGDVRPFLVPSAEGLRTRGPNPLTSRAYARELAEVKKLGAASSATRTAEQTDVALFWDRAPWGDIVRSLAVNRNLNSNDTARLLAMVYLAVADAEIACINDKNYWNWWRPITAIREAAFDGNPATTPDPTWTPLIVTPGFPEHPAGHTCGSGAIVGVLQGFFGTDQIAFSATSPSSGTTRSFTSLSQALGEVIDSRVWGGIHLVNASARSGPSRGLWSATTALLQRTGRMSRGRPRAPP